MLGYIRFDDGAQQADVTAGHISPAATLAKVEFDSRRGRAPGLEHPVLTRTAGQR